MPKVLVVDDEENIRLLLRTVLELDDLDVLTAENGLRALELLKKQKVDIVITDIMMPKMDGWELMKKIREDLKSDVPIIALTVRSDPLSEKLSREKYKVKEYITKPFDRKELVNKVRKYIGN
ncbi:MAG: response regulator [Candidatus Aenigmarchaeota archaeon]|nr:response regulator [Candidatus Aenigmarchaeota archaeon]